MAQELRIKLFSKETTANISPSDSLKRKYEACCKVIHDDRKVIHDDRKVIHDDRKVIHDDQKVFIPSIPTEKRVILVGDMDEDPSFTHAIIFGQVMPELPDDMPRENVIGMADTVKPLFSETFLEYAKRSISQYFVGSLEGLEEYPFFVERPSLLCFSSPTKSIREKNEIMSLAVPNTMQLNQRTKPTPGYYYTNQIIDCIIRNNIPIDIYGAWGLMHQKTNLMFNRIKGSYTNPLEPFEKYAFTIAIEDAPSPHYYSVEKIVHPLISDCVPLYLGCEHIDQYFDPSGVMKLTGNLAKDMNTITAVLKNPSVFYKESDKAAIGKQVNLLRRCAVEGDIFPVAAATVSI